MKQLFLSLFAVCALAGTKTYASISIPSEVSALLQETGYQEILNQQKKEAKMSGRTLHITDLEVVEIPSNNPYPSNKYVYVGLATSFSAEVLPELSPVGSIVGVVSYGPLGSVIFDGIYFSPAPVPPPGGSSVGNQ